MKETKPVEMKLVLGITSPGSIPLIKGQPEYFHKLGYNVFLFSPDNPEVKVFCTKEKCIHIPIVIERQIAPLKDINTLATLVLKLFKIKPDIVNFGTPKMGFLGILAAWLLHLPKRIYTCRGLRYEHEKGIKRFILYNTEKITGKLAHKIICVGPSLKEQALKDHLFPDKKCIVIAKGSSNGIPSDFFSNRIDPIVISDLKQKLNLTKTINYGFIGRLIDRKGIMELYSAFDLLFKDFSNTRLIIVGSRYGNQLSDLVKKIETHPGIIWVGWQQNVQLYFSLFDVCVMPSWWEGFGNVFIQAAAMGLPVIGSNGTGCRDAISDGYNAIQVPVKEIEPLRKAMETYYLDRNLREIHGRNSLIWASNFKSEVIWNGLHQIYQD